MRFSSTPRIILVALTCVAIRPDIARSQQRTGPEAVARDFFDSIAAGRWRDAASLLDLEAFDAYRQNVVRNARLTSAGPHFTVEMLMKRDSTLPRAVAEYEIARMNQMKPDSSGVISEEFADIVTPGQLESLSPLDAAAKMIEAQDFRYQMRIAEKLMAKSCGDSVIKEFPRLTVRRRTILGTVVRDSVAYVLHEGGDIAVAGGSEASGSNRRARREGEEGDDSFSIPPAVMELRKTGVRWVVEGGPGMTGGQPGFGWDCAPRK